MDDSILKIARAVDFAARKHTDQRRKGIKTEPYINHVAEVALLAADATAGKDPDLVIAALLHDTIEDTGVKYDELVCEFGTDVADLVLEVTDDKSLLKAERKRLQIENAHHKSPRAKIIKIADKISNIKAILASPPADWSLARKQEYFDWAAAVVAGCRGVNAWIEEQFDAVLLRKNDLGG